MRDQFRCIPLLTVPLLVACVQVFAGCKPINEPSAPGPAWVTFTTSNSPLQSNIINNVAIDNAQSIWFATRKGACVFTPNTSSWGVIIDSLYSFIYPGPVKSFIVNAIAFAKDGSVWFGLQGNGVVRYFPRSETGRIWTRYYNELQYGFITSLCAERSNATPLGEMWVGTALGCSRYTQTTTDGDGTWISYAAPPFHDRQITAMRVNSVDNKIWFGTGGGGVAILNYDLGLTFENLGLRSDLISRVNAFAFDLQNRAWVGLDAGIGVYDAGVAGWTSYSHLNTNNKLPRGPVHAVETNYRNIRWFGTDSGLTVFSDTAWSRFTSENSPLPNDTVTSLAHDARGNLWIGTRQGVAVYNPSGTILK